MFFVCVNYLKITHVLTNCQGGKKDNYNTIFNRCIWLCLWRGLNYPFLIRKVKGAVFPFSLQMIHSTTFSSPIKVPFKITPFNNRTVISQWSSKQPENRNTMKDLISPLKTALLWTCIFFANVYFINGCLWKAATQEDNGVDRDVCVGGLNNSPSFRANAFNYLAMLTAVSSQRAVGKWLHCWLPEAPPNTKTQLLSHVSANDREPIGLGREQQESI